MSLEVKRMNEMLRTRQFDNLSVKDWVDILLAFLEEKRQEKSEDKKLGRRKKLRIPPGLMVAGSLGVRVGRDAEVSILVPVILMEELSLHARKILCEGGTILTSSYLLSYYQGDLEALEVLREIQGLIIEDLIDSELLVKIALEEDLPGDMRNMAAHSLQNRTFRHTPPVVFWEKLEHQISACPALAGAVASYQIDKGAGVIKAVGLLSRFAPQKGIPLPDLVLILRDGLEKLPESQEGWRTQLRAELAKLPAWALKFLKEEVIPSATNRRQLINLFP